ncbi:hypothetical protein ACVGVM_02385 [Pseudonocardia bannensis]|uniref:hypothetical protein n=1 Tax=Pseudonocardia bannensis TaxID=630973 RepID=UPI001B7CDD88
MRIDPDRRWCRRLHGDDHVDVWLISWATDQADVTWIVFCSEGYSPRLAAASLQDLGLHRATDLTGGFGHGARRDHP